MHNDAPTQTRRVRLGRHLRRNVVGYVALFIAVTMTPLPSWAAATIGTADIKNGAVTTKKLAASAVKTGKIANNAVTSPKIKDGTIGKADLAAATRGFTSIVTERVVVTDVDINEEVTSTARCPEGTVAIAGGASVTPGGLIFIGGAAGHVIRSMPVSPYTVFVPSGTQPSGDNAMPVGWRSTVVNDTGADDRSAYFYAMCASK